MSKPLASARLTVHRCGKTTIIKYLAAWLAAQLFVLDVHGGTTEKEVIDIFDKAKSHLRECSGVRIFVFLDEVNTAPHLGKLSSKC